MLHWPGTSADSLLPCKQPPHEGRVSGNTSGTNTECSGGDRARRAPTALTQTWATSRKCMQSKGEREHVNSQNTATPLLCTWHHSSSLGNPNGSHERGHPSVKLAAQQLPFLPVPGLSAPAWS